jgi:undecaprenyl diphosphate synthase
MTSKGLAPAAESGVVSRGGKLRPARYPRHIAIIMDGNGRWAKSRGFHRSIGHAHGTSRVKEIIREADRLGADVLTLYAFSTENWGRPADEIAALMELLKSYLLMERQELIDNNIKLQVLGDWARFPESVREILQETLDITATNTGMILNFCLNYGSRAEIARAVQAIAREVDAGTLEPSQIDERAISDRLYTGGLPDPDLVIRTSGEFRVSNFLLWQIAYSEIFITDVQWPDFEPSHLRAACESFSQRKRRFGLSDERAVSLRRDSDERRADVAGTP